jgi:hypothetical protein
MRRVNSLVAPLHPITQRPDSRWPGDKNALDDFCHSAASMAAGLGISRRRKLDSLDSCNCHCGIADSGHYRAQSSCLIALARLSEHLWLGFRRSAAMAFFSANSPAWPAFGRVHSKPAARTWCNAHCSKLQFDARYKRAKVSKHRARAGLSSRRQ